MVAYLPFEGFQKAAISPQATTQLFTFPPPPLNAHNNNLLRVRYHDRSMVIQGASMAEQGIRIQLHQALVQNSDHYIMLAALVALLSC